ncbi:MAG: cysteine desulfurase family protein [Fidelibacterota bacterium]
MPYFDHSATTPLRPEVLDVLHSVAERHFGNPSSIHRFGQKARVIREEARRQVASAIGAEPHEIIFTGGGSESNNLVLWNRIQRTRHHVITTVIEHPSILKTLNQLKQFGVTYTAVPVDHHGRVDPRRIQDAITDKTGLISVMMANNEVGTIQPVADIAAIAHDHHIPFHTDAVQVMGKLPLNVRELGCDYLSLSAHKFYGPKGIGLLYVKDRKSLRPLIAGGGQEHGLRSGTENIPALAAMGKAAELIRREQAELSDHLITLEAYFKDRITAQIPGATFNGHPQHHLPGLVSLTLSGIPNNYMLINLDLLDMAVSSGSACSSGSVEPSRILRALGLSNESNLETLRISFGRDNTQDDVAALVDAILSVVQKFKQRRG